VTAALNHRLVFLLAIAASVIVAGLASQGDTDPPAGDVQRLPTLEDFPAPNRVGVVMDLPRAMREPNYAGGSCVHASNIMLLRYQGLEELAAWWRRHYAGGERSDRLQERLTAAGVRFASTMNGDVSFLEWACRTGRGCGIFYKPNHSICLVGLDSEYAYLLDNNYVDLPEQRGYEKVPRAEFIARWQRQYGGFAWALVYQPPPPRAKL
jgi:hypothetical protein